MVPITALENKTEYVVDKLDRLHNVNTDNVLSFINDPSYFFTTTLEYGTTNIYVGDFHGLLRMLDVPDRLFNITTIINGLDSSSQYDGKFVDILLLTSEMVNKLDLTLFGK